MVTWPNVFVTFLAIVSCLLLIPVQGEKSKLRLQLLVPLQNELFSNDGVLPAMNMAIDDINNNTSILPDYELFYESSNTKCDASEGTWQFIKSILDTTNSKSKVITYVGGSCSLVTEPTAALSGRLYRIAQISYASTSPILSDRVMYPLFFRTSPSKYVDLRYAMMNTYNWCYVATLHQTRNVFSLAVQYFHDHFNVLTAPGYNCSGLPDNDRPVLFSFTEDPEIPLTQIKNKNIRIIFGYFYEDRALVAMCYAYKLNLTKDNYLWILPAWYAAGWWNRADDFDWSKYTYNCTSSDIINALDKSLLIDVYPYLVDPNQQSESGYTNKTFFEEYNRRRDAYFNITSSTPKDNIPSNLYTTLIYDAVWAVGKALNKTENQLRKMGHNLTEFEYSGLNENEDADTTLSYNISKSIASYLQESDFIGVSGRVKFDSNGTRLADAGISQYVRTSDNSLIQVFLGVYNRERDNYTLNLSIQPSWKGDSPPTDKNKPESRLLSPAAIYVMNVLIGAGIIVSVVLLIFNIVTIRKPLIWNSAPHINTVIIIGCIVMMASCILLGIDSGTPQVTSGDRADILNRIQSNDNGKQRYAIICMVRVWLLTFGFTLSFGALFAKTWQVYRIYTNEKLKEQPFKMWNFLIIMAVLLIIDVIFLSIWTGAFRFRHLITTVEENHNNVVLMYEKCDCDNFSYLIGVLYVYKGLLVVFGLFLAYESRNVKYQYINDSRFVSISMYIVVILIVISAPVSPVLADRNIVDPSYIVAVSMIVIACVSCLLILYIPKFVYMAKGADTMIPKSKAEVFTPVDNLQLGHTEVNPEDVKTAEQEIKDLKEQVKMRQIELENLQIRRGSDQDSGVLCTSSDEPGGSNGHPESPTSESPEAINETVLTDDKKKTVTITTYLDQEEEEEA